MIIQRLYVPNFLWNLPFGHFTDPLRLVIGKGIKVSAAVKLASCEKVRHPGSHGTRLKPLAKVVSPNNLWISVVINLASAQLEGSHSSKEDISKELVINSSLPLGQEAASSKHRMGHAGILQFSRVTRLRSRGRAATSKVMGRETVRSG